MADIGRVLDKPSAAIYSYLQYQGGIRQRHRFRRAEASSSKNVKRFSAVYLVDIAIALFNNKIVLNF